MPATAILVHGGFDAPWSWTFLEDELGRRGIASIAVDLPSCRATTPTVDVHDDARYARGVALETGGPVVFVGNSYGGAVMTEAAADLPSAVHLVYLAALIPLEGEPILDILRSIPSDELSAAITFRDDGLVEADLESDLAISCAQAPPDRIEYLRAKGNRPMSLGSDPAAGVRAAAWRTVPSTYVVCTEDRSLPADAQRAWAERTTHVVEWPSDHCPHVSHPEMVADLLATIVAD